jgi:hypothetical protein
VRRLVLLITLLFFADIFSGPLAALTEEEKRRLFLRAREEMRAVPRQTPERTPTPRPKPKPATRKKRTPPPTPRPTPRVTPTPTPERRERERRKEREPEEEELETPPPQREERRRRRERPSVVIEKSGLEDESGYAPVPSQRQRGKKSRHLSRGMRAEIDKAPVKRRRWRYIIVHNSGTRQGNARIFDYYHRRTRKMKNGLAYHFVIGNGTSSGDGEIEIGARWRRQINGGHVHSDYLNNIAIGICLVGDFNRHVPTRAQMQSLDELIRYLRLRTGKIDRRYAQVKAHKEVNPPRYATDCPGDRFPVRWLHKTYN